MNVGDNSSIEAMDRSVTQSRSTCNTFILHPLTRAIIEITLDIARDILNPVLSGAAQSGNSIAWQLSLGQTATMSEQPSRRRMLRPGPTWVMVTWLWRSDPWRAGLVGVCTLASGILPGALMVASGAVLAAITAAGTQGSDALGRALQATALFAIVSLAYAGSRYAGQVAEAGLSRRYLETVEDTLARAVLGPVSIAHLEDASVAGRIARATEASREDVYYWSLPGLVQSTTLRITGLVSGCLLFWFTWWAPLLLFVGYAALLHSYQQWLRVGVEDLADVTATSRRRAEYYRTLLAEPRAAKEVRIFSLAPWIDNRFGSIWTTAMESIWRKRGRIGRPMVLSILALVGTHLLVLGALGQQALSGAVSVAAVTVFVQAVVGTDALSRAGYDSLGVVRAGHELANLKELAGRLAQPAQSAESEAARRRGPAAIEVNHLTFTYPNTDDPILQGLDLVVPPGQSLGIVGTNGAGKTTLMKLLAGLYEPGSGSVHIDGENADPRKGRTAAIFQSFGRYELPLRDNVELSSDEADDAAIDRALQAAGADLGIGLHTPLSAAYDGGTDLSGGQWQRVALARALAAVERGAGLLILDEPTANLDVRAEAALFDRFLEVTQGATTILVSHRLSSVRHADRIVVLDDGRLAEDGTHGELMAAEGLYARLFTLQASRFAADLDGASPGSPRGGG